MQRIRRRPDSQHVSAVSDSGNPADQRALAEQSAQLIHAAFRGYNEDFRAITRRAADAFRRRAWRDAHDNAVARIELYERWIGRTVDRLTSLLGENRISADLWSATKPCFAEMVKSDPDQSFPKTFFSSITRRLFNTTGVNPGIEFVALEAVGDVADAAGAARRTYALAPNPEAAIRKLLDDFSAGLTWADLENDVAFVCTALTAAARDLQKLRCQMLEAVFYQGPRAYLVGRLGDGEVWQPLILPLSNHQGVRVEAALLKEHEASILFGFARSYFHVDLESVADTVAFLRTIMPRKPVSELYTMLGRAKQGKTERFRSFFQHFEQSGDRFVRAAGKKGMVMSVFTLPSYDIVFKVIRDRFAYPKNIRRGDVISRYQLVFRHDRAGRLIDAQEFKRLRFARDRFDPELLDELLTDSAATCLVQGADIVIEHCYVERQMVPLDLYLEKADPEQARQAIIEYGQAITDLARSNIFPGDLLLKNFGVSRHGRVIFYDYDELCLLDDCRFRELPDPGDPDEEMRSGAWFFVADNDVFPEQFGRFLGLTGDLYEVFLQHHGRLLTARFWREVQQQIRSGKVYTILPYKPRPECWPGNPAPGCD